MELFRTELQVIPTPFIDHALRIVTAGSCFSDNIGQKLSESKFHTEVNPLGTCYNPVSIHKGLISHEPDQEMFIESEGLWKHFDYHSKFTGSTKSELREFIKSRHTGKTSHVVIITYGTSWVYKHKATGKIVANCHKRPQSEFEKVLLTVDEIIQSFAAVRSLLNQKLILTLSPVRHTKDTLELNSVSKSILRSAIHEIQKRFPNVDYFPAYEIMMDDLRDYRFYEADMIHPSQVAIDYIWKKFRERYFSQPTISLIDRWQKIARSLNHRVFNAGTEQHRIFLGSVLKELGEVAGQLDVGAEMKAVEQRLHE